MNSSIVPVTSLLCLVLAMDLYSVLMGGQTLTLLLCTLYNIVTWKFCVVEATSKIEIKCFLRVIYPQNIAVKA